MRSHPSANSSEPPHAVAFVPLAAFIGRLGLGGGSGAAVADFDAPPKTRSHVSPPAFE